MEVACTGVADALLVAAAAEGYDSAARVGPHGREKFILPEINDGSAVLAEGRIKITWSCRRLRATDQRTYDSSRRQSCRCLVPQTHPVP